MGSGETQDLAIVEIRFGKDRFHQNEEMGTWLNDHFGPGKWYKNAVVVHEDCLWSWESHFGNTSYYFRHERDAMLFSLRWA